MYIYWGWIVVVSFLIIYTLTICVTTVTLTEVIVPMSYESTASLSLLREY